MSDTDLDVSSFESLEAEPRGPDYSGGEETGEEEEEEETGGEEEEEEGTGVTSFYSGYLSNKTIAKHFKCAFTIICSHLLI